MSFTLQLRCGRGRCRFQAIISDPSCHFSNGKVDAGMVHSLYETIFPELKEHEEQCSCDVCADCVPNISLPEGLPLFCHSRIAIRSAARTILNC